ncbi:MAG: extracellular solute-binding protein [Velocimicrobium sp.]
MKKGSIAIVIFVLLAGILSGCNGTKNNDEVNKGRYIEEEINLPEGEQIIGLIQNKKNQIELFAIAYKNESTNYKKYILQADGTWKSQNEKWLDAVNERYLSKTKYDGVAEKIILGEDGAYYALVKGYQESESKNFIFRSTDGAEDCTEIEIPYLEGVASDDSGYKIHQWISDFSVLSNGTLVLNDGYENCLLLFSPKGEELGKLTIEGQNSSMQAGNNIYVDENNIIGIKADSPEILVVDGESQKEIKSLELNQVEKGACVSKLSEGTLVLADKKGIHRMNEGGTLWQTVVDGDLNSMSMPNMYIKSFLVEEGDPEVYYILYQTSDSDGGYSLIHYTYDDTIVSVPEEEVSVYSLQENATLRQAISLFQRKYPDVKVNYVVAMNEEETNSKECIKALNTELIAGNGADVLVLDGLPVESYIKQGVLENISSVCESADVLPNILKGYYDDKNVYEIPTKLVVPLITGEKEAVESAKSLHSIVEYERAHDEKLFVKGASYEEVAKVFLRMQFSSFLTAQNTLDVENFTEYLEDLSYLRKSGALLLKEQGGYAFDSNAYELKIKKTNATWGDIYSMDTLFISEALFKEGGYTIGAIQNSFYGIGCMGINHATKNKKRAEDFLSFILSDEVQKTDVGDGLPVSKKSWDTLLQKEKKDMSYGISYKLEDGSYGMLEADYPSKESRAKFAAIVGTVSHATQDESTVMDMIMTELDGFFNGSKDIKQTIPTIESKVNTYLAEQND